MVLKSVTNLQWVKVIVDVACENWYLGTEILHNTAKWAKFNEAIVIFNKFGNR